MFAAGCAHDAIFSILKYLIRQPGRGFSGWPMETSMNKTDERFRSLKELKELRGHWTPPVLLAILALLFSGLERLFAR